MWLSGEAGIGKTRLLAALEEDARAAGALVLHGAGWEDPSTPAFWLWTRVLREAARAGDSADWGEEARALLAASIVDGDPAGRFPLFDSVTRAVAALADERPVVLVLDDLHWADPGSLKLLRFLAADAVSAQVLLACGWRTGEATLAGEVQELIARAVSVDLSGLDQIAVAELIEATTGVQVDERDAVAVTDQTGGNPLFVTEMARLAASRRSATIAGTMPATTLSTIQRRLARLSQGCHDLLAVASVLGPEGDLARLARLLGSSMADILAAVDEAVGAGLVMQDREKYRFAHTLVRDAAYDAVALGRRRELHLVAASDLAIDGVPDSRAAEVAHHLLCASPLPPRSLVVEALEQASRAAFAMQAYEEAAAHYRTALSLVTDGGLERQRLLLAYGEALLASDNLQVARPAFVDAAEIARTHGDAEAFARAALGYAAGLTGFEVRLGDQVQLQLLREGVGLLPEADSELRVHLLARLSVALSYGTSIEARARIADEALAMARRIGDVRGEVQALSAWCDAHAGPIDAQRREDAATQMLELARLAADRPAELLALRHRVLARMECGKIREVESDVRAFAGIAVQLRQPVYAWYVPLWRGYLAHMRGELDEVQACIGEVDRIGALVGSRNSVMLALTQRLWVLAERLDEVGMRALLKPLVEAVDDQVPTSQVVLQLFPGMPREGHRAAFPLLPQVVEDLPVDAEWLNYLAVFASTLFEEEAPAEFAAVVYDRLGPHRDRYVVDGIGAGAHGSVEHYLAMLASLTGDGDASEAHFARALVANGAAPLHVATTLRARGIARRRRGEDRGMVDLAAARNAYRQMGLSARTAEMESMLGPPAGSGEANRFVREGAVWRVTYAARSTTVRHSKGMADIADLLSQPHHEIHVLDIIGGPVPRQGDLGPVLDAQAKAAYNRRLADLQEAADDGDESATAEREALVAQLASAYGMGGRARPTGATAERARSAVTLRIRSAIARIEHEHPELGRHLRVTVRTGTFCAYEPERDMTWRLTPGLTS